MPRTNSLQLQLTADERLQARRLLKTGRHKSRTLQRLAILLKWDEGLAAKEIAAQLPVSLPTIYNVWHRYQAGRLQAVLDDKPVSGQPRRLDAHGEATLLALACSQAPDGYSTWTMQLLADKLVEMKVVSRISDECVRQRLKKVASNRG